VLPPNESHQFLFDNEEERAFLFYSPHNGGTITLVINFCVPVDKSEDVLNIKGDMEGFGVEISSWSEKTTAGTGKKVALASNVAPGKGKGTKTEAYDCAEQRVEFADSPQEGRFEITLSSPFESTVFTEIRVDSSKSRYKHIHTNGLHQEMIPGGDAKEFEVSLPGAGYWYFDLIACIGDVSVQYGENSKAEPTKLCSEGPERELFLKEKITAAETKYLKISVEGDELGNGANLLMTSAYYSEDKGLLSYEATGDAANELELTYNYDYKGDDSVLEIAFRAPVLKGYDKSDTNTFDIRLCLKEYATDDEENICAALNRNQRCDNAVISGDIEKIALITKTFESVFPGEYQLSILRKVQHGDHIVRSFVLRNVDITLKEPFLSRIWDFTVTLFSGILLILAIYFVYLKVRSGKMDQDASIRKSPKKKGYGFVGEDDEADEDNNLRKDN